MFTTNPYLRALTIFFLALVLFTVARVALYVTYYDDYQNLSLQQTVISFIHGIRFDAAVTIMYIGLPLVFLMLPFRWAKSSFWQNFWAWVIYFFLLVFAFTLIADNIYYGFVHRHAGPEILLIMGDIPLMIDMALSNHLIALVIFTVTAFYFAKLWRTSFSVGLDENKNALKNGIFVFILFLTLIVVGRGGLQHKPIKVSDAFIDGNPSAAYLTLNGTFAITQALRGTKPKSVKFMPDDEAIRITQEFVKGENETFIDPEYPLMRKVTHDEPSSKPNIVVLMIESFDAAHFDRLRKINGLHPLGSTPNLDKISESGILFSNLYATGQRSMDGLAAVLASVPTLPGFPYLGQGLEQNRLGFMGNIAKEQGYSTIFLQSSQRGSFHVDSIAAQAGFDQYYGAEDIPPAHTDLNTTSNWGAWDHDTLQFAHKKYEETKKPFLSFIFTSTTHTPWRVPADRWKKHPGDDNKSRYLNSLYYADWVVGQFMKKAKESEYYENTIFLITGDHISRFAIDVNDVKTQFHIPLIISGKGIEAKIDPQIGNQMDILPTVINLAKWETVHSSLGVSLVGDNSEHFSFSVGGVIVSYIDKTQSYLLAESSVINLKQTHQKELAAALQSITNLTNKNRIITEATGALRELE